MTPWVDSYKVDTQTGLLHQQQQQQQQQQRFNRAYSHCGLSHDCNGRTQLSSHPNGDRIENVANDSRCQPLCCGASAYGTEVSA
ncbi:hypothetical protein KC321_g18867 [Hortaea werneckii]|nr:hypothetical protein KC321_g18867 [Hortaea werneckii]KAI6954265.1 hypothetical protein KC329_g18838 [Hortaea werneckii]